MKKIRLLVYSLAFSLAFGQTVQAAGFITPFGTTQVYQESTVAPGNVAVAPEETQAPVVQTPGTEQQTAQQGPGAVMKNSSVVLPSASYSTKEPVMVSGAQVNQTSQSSVSAGTIDDLEKAAAAAEIKAPEISAEGAILYDVTHDRFIYEKNADEQFYPASITKVLTALLVLENAKMDEMVTFSETAVTKLESGAVTLQLQAGDKVSVKDCLYGLMLKSANEVANGLAEHVGGSIEGFAKMMNEKAKALGCTNSNFVNPNGLNDKNHHTTARDMAKIVKAAFANEEFCKIVSTTSYKFPATKAAKERTISMGHRMVYKSDSRYYNGIIGGKTGYTSLAGNTLVTCVERDGVRMVAVILKSRSTHYADTKALFDYGFSLSEEGILTQSGAVVSTQPGNTSSNGTATQNAGPGAASSGSPGAVQTTEAYHKWIVDGSIWRFELADGTRLANCVVTIDGCEYAFDTEGKMVTGWLALGENWHYFGSSGAMVKKDWRQDNTLWFYLGEDGAVVKNAWIDNMYYVGADGVWVQ